MHSFSENDLVNFVFGSASKELAAAIKREAQANKELAAEIAVLRSASGAAEQRLPRKAIAWGLGGVLVSAACAVLAWMAVEVTALQGRMDSLSAENSTLKQQIAVLRSDRDVMTASVHQLRTELQFAINAPLDDADLLPPGEASATSRRDGAAIDTAALVFKHLAD